MSRVLVCGGRDLDDIGLVWSTLDTQHFFDPIQALIHGGAAGADALAEAWARRAGVVTGIYPANWKAHGKKAGPLRNAQMLAGAPSLVIAFPGGRGTADMVRRAKAAGVPVNEVSR